MAPTTEEQRALNIGWAVLAAYVLGYDYWAIRRGRPTLTEQFARGMAHPIGRYPVAAVWTITTLHLFARLPSRIDPYRLAGQVLARAVLAKTQVMLG